MYTLYNEDLVQVNALQPAQQEVFYQFLSSLQLNNVDFGNWEFFHKYKAICLIRFLRSRSWDVNSAYHMLIQCLEWRRQEGIDDISNRVAHNKNAQMLLNSFPATLHGEDREGIPVYFERLGSVDIRQVFSAVPNEVDWLVYHTCQLEDACLRVAEAYTRQNKPFQGINVVENMQGLSFRHWYLPAVHILKRLLAVDMAYYPEMLQHVYIVNAPSVFWVMWKLVKPMMDPYTAEKLTVFGNDFTPLTQVVDPRSLPELFGGSCLCKVGGIQNGIFSIPDHSELKHDSISVAVARSSIHELPIILEAGYLLRWEFSVDHFDISFGVVYETDGMPRQTIVPFRKVDAHDQVVGGECVIWHSGTYILVWDNSNSFLRSKKISLKYSVEEYTANQPTTQTAFMQAY